MFKDCACFPKDSQQPRVSELASKYGRYERRVVYLFKHQDSGSVSIYVPNQEKQDKFPDLTVGKTDKYGFPSLYNLLEIFKNPSTLSQSIILPKPEKLYNKTILKPSKPTEHEKKTENESEPTKPTDEQDHTPDDNHHVEQPQLDILPGDKGNIHDGQHVQLPLIHVLPGDKEHTHDGQHVQLPLIHVIPGDKEHTHDGQHVQLPLIHVIPGDKEHTHDGQHVQLPLIHVIPGDKGHTHDGQHVQLPLIHVIPGDKEHTHDGQHVQLPLIHVIPGDKGHTHDGQHVRVPHFHVLPGDKGHTHDGQHVRVPHFHVLPGDKGHTHDGQHVRVPHFHVLPGDKGHTHDGQHVRVPHFHVLPGDKGQTNDHENVQTPDHLIIIPGDKGQTNDDENVEKPEHLFVLPGDKGQTNDHENVQTPDHLIIIPGDKGQTNEDENVEKPEHLIVIPGDKEQTNDDENVQTPDHLIIIPGDKGQTDHEKRLEPNNNVRLNLTIVEEPELIPSNPVKENIRIDIIEDLPSQPSKNDEKIVENNQNILNLILDEENNVILPSPEDIQIPNSPQFNEWLLEQIKVVDNDVLGLKLPNDIEVQRFKYLLINLITKSGFRVTELGDLLDENGRVLKLSNLILKRVMISDPAVYKHIMTKHKCIVPHDIPYLEAVFVGLARPPRILGVIPLRMTLLPKCKGNQCTQNSQCNPATGKISPLDLNHAVKLDYSPEIGRNLYEPAIIAAKEESRSHSEPELTLNLNPGDLKVILHQYLDQADNGENVDESITIDDDDDEEVIFPKIVGGNAATSSGTPVNSRGRSGYNDHWYFVRK
ncbi:unnamed protein product [Danaus chrysippus]|uniref:(African queen) hypothetical protein n=1 Tax=Danaus chrysippus TaxID=151541 RepID=A0A8J2VYT1_9NEOP|nr:unnamed protein product [Danaus chrysippus]